MALVITQGLIQDTEPPKSEMMKTYQQPDKMKPETRKAWASWLRKNENMRINRVLVAGKGDKLKVCAVGALGLVCGVSPETLRIQSSIGVLRASGLSSVEAGRIVGLNDMCVSWDEIADQIENPAPLDASTLRADWNEIGPSVYTGINKALHEKQNVVEDLEELVGPPTDELVEAHLDNVLDEAPAEDRELVLA